MKKISIFTLAVMMLLVTASRVFADGMYTKSPDFNTKVEPLSVSTINVASSNITTGNRVFGFTFSDSTAGVVGLYDCTSITTVSNNFGEAYVAAGGVATVIFPFPKKIVNGVVIGGTNATGRVIIYYE